MNNENLRPQNLRTKEEQREIARKGGIASGESRRRSRSMKTILKQMARMDVINEDLKAILESMGVDPTQDVAMAFSIVNEAIRGNVRAFDAYMKYTGQDTLREATIKQVSGEAAGAGSGGDVGKLIAALEQGAAADWAGYKEETDAEDKAEGST